MSIEDELIKADEDVNGDLGGNAKVTISRTAYLAAVQGSYWGVFREAWINLGAAVFFGQRAHCESCKQ